MPNDFALKTANTIHRSLLKLTRGRVGGNLSNMPVLELITTGRKSGQKRSVMLTTPYQDGDSIIVVASRGGDDQSPAWFLNLRDNPDVEVALAGKPKQRMYAHVATPEERARLWPLVTADHKNYAGYQTKTAREIPLVMLQPAR